MRRLGHETSSKSCWLDWFSRMTSFRSSSRQLPSVRERRRPITASRSSFSFMSGSSPESGKVGATFGTGWVRNISLGATTDYDIGSYSLLRRFQNVYIIFEKVLEDFRKFQKVPKGFHDILDGFLLECQECFYNRLGRSRGFL